jgi:hypothetical protein
MRRFLIVYLMGVFGALAGAASGPVLLSPSPVPGPNECGMWILPGTFLGGAVGAAVMSFVGVRLTRRANASPPDAPQGPL